MTTIVWDKKSLAWDSQITQGDEIKLRGEKGRRIWTPDGEAVVAVCGNIGYFEPVVAAVSRGRDPLPIVPKDDEETAVLVLRRSGLICIESGMANPVPNVSAWGTGSMAAYAGLHLGYDSAKACALACAVDLHSQEPVFVVAMTKLRRKRPVSAKEG